MWRQVSVKRKPFEIELRLRRKDGAYRRFFIQGAPFLSDTGEVLEWHGTNTDIEDRKQADEALQHAQSRLEKVMQVSTMAEMAAAIAHEINQPLGAIVNNSSYCLQLLAKRGAEEEKRAALNDIVNDANRASAIIGRIRGLTNGSTPEVNDLDFRNVIEEVVTLSQRAVTEHRIDVRPEVAKNLPRLRGDRVQLQQVLLNLVTNAIEAMRSPKEDTRTLTIQAARGKLKNCAAVVVAVSDTGVGFKPEAAEQMFDAFYTTKSHGMGMGLRISRSIVEAYGGNLSATGKQGQGATFTFVLPAKNNAR
jgi:C4-dicarboxylate-specific signal transduction histidine kinase